MKVALQTKRPETHKVRLLDDNARAHTAKVTGEKLEALGWQVLPSIRRVQQTCHRSDYYLFRSFRHHLSEKHFDDQDNLESHFETSFFRSHSKKMVLWIYLGDGSML